MLEESTKKKSKLPLIIVIALIIAGLVSGFFVYKNFTNKESFKIGVEDSKLYPNFSEDVDEYVIYTNQKQIKFTCPSTRKTKGCNKLINVDSDEQSYTITNNGKTYKIKIYRLEDSNSNIKITNVKGIPTSWVKEAKLKVEIDNPSEIDNVKYSFDGGETWQSKNTYTITSNENLVIVVKDYFGYLTEEKKVKIEYVDNIKPKVKIETKEENGVITLTAVATDDQSGIKSYSWNDGITDATRKAEKNNKYTVEVLDNVGNKTTESIFLDLEQKQVNPQTDIIDNPSTNTNNGNGGSPSGNSNVKTNSVRFDGNGSNSGKDMSCQSSTGTCKITAPPIERGQYEIIGWSKNKNSRTAEVPVGSEIIISENTTYYAITRRMISSTFEVQDNNVASIKANRANCYIYNTENKCSVTTPGISTISGYKSAGWNTDRNATSALAKDNSNMEISDNMKLYSMTYEENPISVTFKENGADSISAIKKSCYKYNGASSCNIKSPTIVGKTGFTALGWDTKSTSITATWEQEKEKSFSANATYYAITRTTNKHKASFIVQDESAITIDKTVEECYGYNGNKNCNISIATQLPKQGYEAIGWSTNKNATASEIASGTTKQLSSNITYYSITKNQTPITITFNKNKASEISDTSKKCYKYNGETSCSITSPTITGTNEFDGVGWNTENTNKVTWEQNKSLKVSKNATYYAITKSKTAYTASFKITDNTAGTINKNKAECYRYNNETSCNVTAAIITPNSAHDALGWNTSATAKSATIKNGGSIELTKNETYYAITKSSNDIMATFIVQDESAATLSTTEVICEKYNGSTACNITIPEATVKTGYEIIGWNEEENKSTATKQSGNTVTLTKDQTYYLVTKNKTPITITFEKAAATSISSTKETCYKYNGASSCKIKSPTITPKSGFEALGWNKTITTTSAWEQNKEKSVSSNATYYAITRSTTADTIEFIIKDKNAATISANSVECYKYNTDTECSVKLPTITSKNGYQALGWTEDANSYDNPIEGGSTISISGVKKFYTVTRVTAPVTVTFKQNASSTADTTKSCYKYNGASTCNIKSPTITPKSGFDALGWNTSSTANTSSWNQNESKSFGSSQTYYAITRSSSAIKATFIVQDSNAVTTNKASESCYKYNGATNCKVTTPTMTAKTGYEVIGWNQTADSTTATIAANKEIDISSNITYYSITKNKTKIQSTFNLIDDRFTMTVNNLSGQTSTASGNKYILGCNPYNGSTSCKVRTPKIASSLASSGNVDGLSVHGWNTDQNAKTATAGNDSIISIISNSNYYSITSETVLVKFFNSSSKTTLQGSTSTSCRSYNKNGCTISESGIPLVISEGTSTFGFSTTKGSNSKNDAINLYQTIFKNDTSLYVIEAPEVYTKDTDGKTHQMKTEKTLGKVTIESDLEADREVITAYLKVIDEVYSKWPELFNMHGKLILLENKAYEQTTGGGSGGLTRYAQNIRIFIPVSDTIYEYTKGSIVHELGHAFDAYYGYRTGTWVREKTDFLNLYNTNKNMNPRPMRKYSYKKDDNGSGTIAEHVADLFRFTYIDKFNTIEYGNKDEEGYTHKSTPAIQNITLKYICIARNNYNEGASSCQ